MRKNRHKVLPGLIFVASLVGPTGAYAGKCFATFPEQRLSGQLAPGASIVVREWGSRCTGLFTSSAARGTPALLELVGGKWVRIRSGASIHLPQLGPGNYRFVVENPTPSTVTYSVRFRTSGG